MNSSLRSNRSRPWVIAESGAVIIYRCGECGDNHVDVGTVSLRFSSDGLERFYECLVCLSAREPLTSLRSVRTRPWAFGFQGMPFQVVLSDAELGNLVTAVESAVRLLKKLQLGTELRCKN